MKTLNWDSRRITEDNANFHQPCRAMKIHNQGTYVVEVNGDRLLPDDQIIIEADADEVILFRAKIRFLSLYPFTKPITTYPQLISGKHLLISYLTVAEYNYDHYGKHQADPIEYSHY